MKIIGHNDPIVRPNLNSLPQVIKKYLKRGKTAIIYEQATVQQYCLPSSRVTIIKNNIVTVARASTEQTSIIKAEVKIYKNDNNKLLSEDY